MSKADGKDSLGIVIVSGLSGAGKTVVLRALEDSGYFCIDNLPVILIEPFLSTFRTGENIKKIGIGVDIREKEFLSNAYQTFLALKSHYNVEILFLEAEKDVIVRRYKETRRPHPMIARHGDMNMETAIQQEKTLLSLIREAADKIVDTSNYTPHQLRHLILSNYENSLLPQSLNLSIISFGFKFGVPQNLDLLFDVRFLPNPYFIPELKLLKGIDSAVSCYILKRKETREFLTRIYSLLDFLIPRYIAEGKTYLIIGIGCTGGMHRSPAIVQEVSCHIEEKHSIKPTIIHRDME